MDKMMILYWAPRVLAIAIILFLGLFALDVFDGKSSVSEMIGGFLIHLLPNFILATLLVIAWKNEILGGMLFIFAALLMWLFFDNPFAINLVLFGPIFLTGVFFLTHDYLNTNSD